MPSFQQKLWQNLLVNDFYVGSQNVYRNSIKMFNLILYNCIFILMKLMIQTCILMIQALIDDFVNRQQYVNIIFPEDIKN